MITTKQKIGEWFGSGCECVVYEYENDKVLKVYMYDGDAEHAIHYGRIAFENGMGPEVFSGEPFEHLVKYLGRRYRYAIICERVRTAEIEDFDDYNEDSGEPMDRHYDELCNKSMDIFGSTFDLHVGNLGWSKDGQLIMIDFGPESIS